MCPIDGTQCGFTIINFQFMKKIFLLFFASFFLLLLFSEVAQAANICNESSNNADEVNGTAPFNKDHSGGNGIVPCGNNIKNTWWCNIWVQRPNGWQIIANLVFFGTEQEANQQCVNARAEEQNNEPGLTLDARYGLKGSVPICPCQLSHVFVLIFNIYKFIVVYVATPLAALLMVLGGVMWVVSAGNPGLLDMGKRMFGGAVWGLVLIFGSWLIINVVLVAIGYSGGWSGISF